MEIFQWQDLGLSRETDLELEQRKDSSVSEVMLARAGKVSANI